MAGNLWQNWGRSKVSFHPLDVRHKSEFTKDQMDAVRAAIGYKPSARLEG
jgi:hypothetical protein